MRVVIAAGAYYPSHASGADRLAYDEAVFLAARGHQVTLVCRADGNGEPGESVDRGVRVLRYRRRGFGALDPRRAGAHQRLTRQALAHHLAGSMDLVHGHSLLQYRGALSRLGAGVRTAYSVHSPVRLEFEATARGASGAERLRLLLAARMLGRLERAALSGSSVVTADSAYTRELLGTLHGPGIRDKTSVVPGWVDLERFQIAEDRDQLKQRLGWPADRPVVLTVRRLVPRMGLDRLVRAAGLLRSAGHAFHLVIGGSGPLRARLETLVGELGLGQVVGFAGFIAEETLPLMMGAADAFVLPTSELECFGLPVLEALACGRPVLAAPVGAIPELLRLFEPAWLASGSAPEAIAELLARFLSGALPAHDPSSLRAGVAAGFARDRVLGRLTRLALGEDAG